MVLRTRKGTNESGFPRPIAMEIQTNEAPSKCIRGEPVEPRTDERSVFPMHPVYRLRRNGQLPRTLLSVARIVRIHDAQRPHHLFVFVFDDVAVPGVKPSEVEVGPDPQ